MSSRILELETEYYKIWNNKLKYSLLPNDINVEVLLEKSIKTGDSLLQSYVKTKYEDVEFTYFESLAIPYAFKQTKPSKQKIDFKKRKLRSGQIEPVIINRNNTIIDNYITYLIFIQNGEKFIPIKYCSDEVYSNQTRLEILGHRYNDRCYICNRKVSYNKNDENRDNFATADHIIPLSFNGADTIDNLALCCKFCNNLKGNFTYSEELKNLIIKELQIRGIM